MSAPASAVRAAGPAEQAAPANWKRLVPRGIKDAAHTARALLRLLLALRSPGRAVDVLCGPILEARRRSCLSTARLLELYRLAIEVDRARVPGAFVECGVYRGGSAAILGHALEQGTLRRELWLFDSFQGMPASGDHDGEAARALRGEVRGDAGEVAQLLRHAGFPAEQAHIVPGWFADTFPGARIGAIALLHIDADWYDSVRLCLENFYDALAEGAVVVLDDYYDWPGCRTALDDFARARGLTVRLLHNGDGTPHFRISRSAT